MSSSVKLSIQARGKPIPSLPRDITYSTAGSTSSLYELISRTTGYSVHRLRLSLVRDGSDIVSYQTNNTLAGAGIVDGSDIFVKDLDRLAHRLHDRVSGTARAAPAALLHPPTTSHARPDPDIYMIMLQFTKRELETIFVHRFSNATMPLRNLFKNCGHYWILSGGLLGWFVYTSQNEPSLTTTHERFLLSPEDITPTSWIGICLFILGASLNAYIHLLQRSLRPSGTVQRKVPSGLGFAWVTCPNYMFETLAWLGIWLVSRSWAIGLFIAVAVAQMKLWANKKEARYRREFPGQYVKKRYGVIPGVL